ncbi:ABC transporter permease [Streptomyces sp. NPDC059679]|uniref:ABC transporter permease n=1 Tax=Streptomyces sp. NPDC059679 TaxID=3346903 RepID=UPI0036ACE8EB
MESATATGQTEGVRIYRNDRIPEAASGGISVQAVNLDLPKTAGLEMAAGRWLNSAQAEYPAVVLGSAAAERLGVSTTGLQVWLGKQTFTVTGILQPAALARELDNSALVGWSAAKKRLGSTATRQPCTYDPPKRPSTRYAR